MEKVERFFDLKEQWKNATDNHRCEIDKEIKSLLDSMTESELSMLTYSVQRDFDTMKKEAIEIKNTLTIREKLEKVLPYISVSTISKNYFGKSSSWFYQRLNGNKVHGKPVSFTPNEIERLNKALQDIGDKLSAVSL